MKIKSDFITNSSSSSFIVAFDKFPETVDEMMSVLFEEGQSEFVNPYRFHHSDPSGWSVNEVSEFVLSLTKAAEKSELEDEVRNLVEIDWDKFRDEHGNMDWGAYHKAEDGLVASKVDELLNNMKNKFICIYEFSDNDGKFYSALEHGDLFRHLQHIRISKH